MIVVSAIVGIIILLSKEYACWLIRCVRHLTLATASAHHAGMAMHLSMAGALSAPTSPSIQGNQVPIMEVLISPPIYPLHPPIQLPILLTHLQMC